MIELERRLELAFEGDRWADLNRLGNAIAVKAIRDRVGQALFPIPLRDTRTSPKLTQNPSYQADFADTANNFLKEFVVSAKS